MELKVELKRDGIPFSRIPEDSWFIKASEMNQNSKSVCYKKGDGSWYALRTEEGDRFAYFLRAGGSDFACIPVEITALSVAEKSWSK